VATFETEAIASDAISPWFEQTRTAASSVYDTSALYPVAVETVADESRAVAGISYYLEDDDVSYEFAAVAVRDGETLYTFQVWGNTSSLVDVTIGIAKRVLGIEPLEFAPVPDVGYVEGGLFDLLPRIEHLHKGMTWDRDTYPCVGVFGANECPVEGTPESPEATPVSATPPAAP
jgi:hypothetical protein